MNFTIDGNTADIEHAGFGIHTTMSIHRGEVLVEVSAQGDGQYLAFDFTAEPRRTWEVNAEGAFDEYRKERREVRSIVTAALLAVDSWATEERFAESRVKDAEAKAQVARQAREAADADLAAAEAELDRVRAGR